MSSFPDRAALTSVLDVAARAPSLANRQPWRWLVDGSAVRLYADWGRQGGDAPTDRRDVLLGCGAVLDHCAVALAAAGWRSRVRRFPGSDDDGPLAVLEVVEQPPDPVHLELAAAIPLRRADRRAAQLFEHAVRERRRARFDHLLRWAAPVGLVGIAKLMGARVIEHRLGVVRGQDHTVDVFGQHRPEAPGTTRQVEDKPWLARHFQGLAYQPRIAPRRQALCRQRFANPFVLRR